ncbi:hypothetical protein K432DRAFT_178591 [Lepidopterella palustris CBS 459.81]|uniref:Uncharacterized protein n=1 Tax=Lepidopterella palustris CBS 459.81 TaxID=1314670 RepID=A0A8E2EGS8_9PEZI|nr:hypothetical protein K432DRAFT_178591 [Lepidopterella palustris CBS 459.81]
MLAGPIRKSQIMALHARCRSIALCGILAFSSAILSPMLMATNVCGFSWGGFGFLALLRSHTGGYLVTNLSPFKINLRPDGPRD